LPHAAVCGRIDLSDFLDGQAHGFRDHGILDDPHLHDGYCRRNPVRDFDVGLQWVAPPSRAPIRSRAAPALRLVGRVHGCHRSFTLIVHRRIRLVSDPRS